jgi:hypothetical protein
MGSGFTAKKFLLYSTFTGFREYSSQGSVYSTVKPGYLSQVQTRVQISNRRLSRCFTGLRAPSERRVASMASAIIEGKNTMSFQMCSSRRSLLWPGPAWLTASNPAKHTHHIVDIVFVVSSKLLRRSKDNSSLRD